MQKNSERLIYFCHKIIVEDVVGSFAPLNMMHLKCAIRQRRYSVAQKIGREGGREESNHFSKTGDNLCW